MLKSRKPGKEENSLCKDIGLKNLKSIANNVFDKS